TPIRGVTLHTSAIATQSALLADEHDRRVAVLVRLQSDNLVMADAGHVSSILGQFGRSLDTLAGYREIAEVVLTAAGQRMDLTAHQQWLRHHTSAQSYQHYQTVLDTVPPTQAPTLTYVAAIVFDRRRLERLPEVTALSPPDRGDAVYRVIDRHMMSFCQANLELHPEILPPPQAMHLLTRLLRPDAVDDVSTSTCLSDTWTPGTLHEQYRQIAVDGIPHATLIARSLPGLPVTEDWLHRLTPPGEADWRLTIRLSPHDPEKAADTHRQRFTDHKVHQTALRQWGFESSMEMTQDLADEGEMLVEHQAGYTTWDARLLVTLRADSEPALESALAYTHSALHKLDIHAQRANGQHVPAFWASMPGPQSTQQLIQGAATRATTRRIRSLLPCFYPTATGPDGIILGQEAFTRSPFIWHARGMFARGYADDLNVAMVGRIHMGKTALAEVMARRHALLGYRILMIFVKPEGDAFAQALGTQPIRLTPGGDIHLNVLDFGAGSAGSPRDHVRVLHALARRRLGQRLTPEQADALTEAARITYLHAGWLWDGDSVQPDAHMPILSDLITVLGDLAGDTARQTTQVRDLYLALRTLTDGPLAGLIDQPTSVGMDLTHHVVLDLSASIADPDVRDILYLVTMSWAYNWVRRTDYPTMFIADEAWSLFRDPETALWLQAQWKLSRQWGVVNVFITQDFSDLEQAGPTALSLFRSCSTRIIFRQSADDAVKLQQFLHLSDVQRENIVQAAPGRALWLVGAQNPHAYLVDHRFTAEERQMTYTDGAIEREMAP
ncbi:MAG: hypothetical protein M1318_06175, partial [Firmicutes bacterium]|nr:hypothetical protein [Bacillota bacterium]